MTLIIHTKVGKSEINPEPFLIATSDTRMVYKMLNTRTLEFKDELIGSRNDVQKITRISDNVLLSCGGISSAYKSTKDFLINKSKTEYFLDDFEKILIEEYKTVMENTNKLAKRILKEKNEQVSIRMDGFFKDGDVGQLIIRRDGTIEREKAPSDNYGYWMFSPTEEIEQMKDELLDFSNSPFIEMLSKGGYISDFILEHLLYVHSIIASQETETVSQTCIVHFLQIRDGKPHYEVAEFDLSQRVKQIQDFAASNAI